VEFVEINKRTSADLAVHRLRHAALLRGFMPLTNRTAAALALTTAIRQPSVQYIAVLRSGQ
jgi:hypothetical protein